MYGTKPICSVKYYIKNHCMWALVAHTCNPSYWEAEIRRLMVQGQPCKYFGRPPISKITRAKWTGGVAQAVELLHFASAKP
jgi:hypothetical protein